MLKQYSSDVLERRKITRAKRQYQSTPSFEALVNHINNMTLKKGYLDKVINKLILLQRTFKIKVIRFIQSGSFVKY